jgi:hypothetical protein
MRLRYAHATGLKRSGDPLGVMAGFNLEGSRMRVLPIVFCTAALLASGSVFAFHCPTDMKKIDDAMAKKPNLTAAQMDDVKKYRAEGETLHKAGKHQESVDTLAKAEKILNIQ